MLTIKPVPQGAAQEYLSRELGLPTGSSFCLLAEEGGQPLAAAAFGLAGGRASLLAIVFPQGEAEAGLADGILRAALNYAEVSCGATHYLIPGTQGLPLEELGYRVGEAASIPDFFAGKSHCGGCHQ